MTKLSEHGDLTLMELWSSGDEDAAREFVARNAAKLASLVQRNMAQRFLRRFDPEDVVNSVFRSLFRKAQNGGLPVAENAALRAYVLVVTLNKLRNSVKRESREKNDIRLTISLGDHADNIPEPKHDEAKESLEVICHISESLGPSHVAVLNGTLRNLCDEEISIQMNNISTRSIRRYRQQIFERYLLQESN